MKFSDRTAIVENLPYESRLGFVAFSLERALSEAGRHPVAREQLVRSPLLTEGLEMLWARSEDMREPDPQRMKVILDHVLSYESPAPDRESVVYNADVNLVHAARTLAKGLRLLQNADEAARYVAGAFSGAVQAVGSIYADWQQATTAETAVADAALERLKIWGHQPFSRAVFDGIPDWPRSELTKKYAENRLKGSALDDDE